jgi:hypothetical protein
MTLMMTMMTIVAYSLATKWEWKDSAHAGAVEQ